MTRQTKPCSSRPSRTETQYEYEPYRKGIEHARIKHTITFLKTPRHTSTSCSRKCCKHWSNFPCTLNPACPDLLHRIRQLRSNRKAHMIRSCNTQWHASIITRQGCSHSNQHSQDEHKPYCDAATNSSCDTLELRLMMLFGSFVHQHLN
jgi:hypothetical protein